MSGAEWANGSRSAFFKSKFMKNIDKQLRTRIQVWLSKEKHNDVELAEGALVLLQCNRNRALYNTIMRRPARFEEKIAYELRKHLRYLKDDINLDEVRSIENQVVPEIKKVLEVPVADDKPLPGNTFSARGKRPDHDSLPEAIRAIWDKNAERYKKMKQAHETAKTLSAACDRYEFVKALAELWADYKKDFDTYDHYVLLPVNEEAGASATPPAETVSLSAEDVKAISSARSYITKNLPKLQKLVKLSKKDGFEQAANMDDWRGRIQERIDILVRFNQVIGDEMKAKLNAAGLDI